MCIDQSISRDVDRRYTQAANAAAERQQETLSRVSKRRKGRTVSQELLKGSELIPRRSPDPFKKIREMQHDAEVLEST